MPNPKKTINRLIFIILITGILLTTFYLDKTVLLFSKSVRNTFADKLFGFITKLGNPIILVVVIVILFQLTNKKHNIPLAIFTVFLTSVFILLIKSLIARARPEGIIISLYGFLNYSFPSMHSAVVFSILPLLSKLYSKKISWLVLIVASVSISRLYLGLHYLSDVIFGGVIGYFVGKIVMNFEKEDFITTPLKFSRQLVHILVGISLALLIHFDKISNIFLLIILVIGFLLSAISKKTRIPIIGWFLDKLERKRDMKRFPGKGLITYIMGAFIVNLFFTKDIASGSLMILALGDPVSYIIGMHYRKTKPKFGKKKFLDGTFFAIILGFMGAVFFVKPLEAFIASTISMLIEAIEIRFGFIRFDDNLIIPIIAGVVIYVMRILI